MAARVFFDTHAHVDAPEFDADRTAVLERAREAGITDLVCIGASDGIDSNPRTLKLASEHPHIYATVGIHPHDAKIVDDDVLSKIEGWSSSPKVVAIGETGLDYHYDNSPRDAQKNAFREFIRMAKRVRKPIVVHTREAEDDTVRILQEEGADVAGGIIHCFSGTQKLADAALEIGFHLSFSGVLTFKWAEEVRTVARNCPRERALVETDCPYLAPPPHRGKRNEPAYILETTKKLAELWDNEVEAVMEQTGRNALTCFGLGG